MAGLAGTVAFRSHNLIRWLWRSAGVDAAEAATLPEALTDHELNSLTAFGLALIPSSFAARRAAAEAVIRAILQQRHSEAEMRTSVGFLDAKSASTHGLPFAELDIERCRGLVDALLRPYVQRTFFSNPYYYLTEYGRSVRHLWHSVASPINVGFYQSSLGWQVVGYAKRPGECSNLVDYQFPPA